jgi:hypothetical protein
MKNALVIIISFVLISSSFAQEIIKKEDLTNYALSEKKVSQEKDVKDNFHKSISASTEKSPVLGAVLSGLVPGAGEFYAKSYIKAGIFLALEAGLWYGYINYQNKGDAQTEYYHTYADQNWNIHKYAQWIHDKVTGGASVNPNEQDLNVLRSQLNAVESQNFSHTLPVFGTQQYYELIGKYQNFVAGWPDADITVINQNGGASDPNWYENYKTPIFISYSYDRQRANDYYDISTRFVMGVIVNHVLSAADAVWSVNMFNKKMEVKTGMRVEERYGGIFMEKYSLPTAKLTVQF